MKKIASFQIDHNTHKQGFHLSTVKDKIFTYDLRFKKPNSDDYLSNAVIHTIEHLFATAVRNSAIKDKVVYFGPMGCRTGFYLLLSSIPKEEALPHAIACLVKCIELEHVPGANQKECGNYLEHDLDQAKKQIFEYLQIVT